MSEENWSQSGMCFYYSIFNSDDSVRNGDTTFWTAPRNN